MDLQRLKTRRAVVDRAFNIHIQEEYIDPAYVLFSTKDSSISKTGLLKIFELRPNDHDSPTFVGRWDLNKEALDVDIHNVSPLHRLQFKTGHRGYKGHQTVRTDKDSRVFKIDIETAEKQIYRGTLSLNVNWAVEIAEQAMGNASMSFKVIH